MLVPSTCLFVCLLSFVIGDVNTTWDARCDDKWAKVMGYCRIDSIALDQYQKVYFVSNLGIGVVDSQSGLLAFLW